MSSNEETLRSILNDRERELLELKGPCSAENCVLHYAHYGPCNIVVQDQVTTEKALYDIHKRIKDCSSYNFGMRNADKLAHEDALRMYYALGEATDTLKDVIKTHEGDTSTHYVGCHRYHASCLAVKIADIIEQELGVGRNV